MRSKINNSSVRNKDKKKKTALPTSNNLRIYVAHHNVINVGNVGPR